MKIIPKQGIEELQFGMKQDHVTGLYGAPDRQFKDEDGNVIYLYYDKKLRLSFYADEDFLLCYMISSNPNLSLFEKPVIRMQTDAVKLDLEQHGLKSWQREEFDMTTSYYNEANWLTLESEFAEVVKVELGAMINDKDEFEFKFKAKK